VGVGVGVDSDRRPCSRSFGAVLFGLEGNLDPVQGEVASAASTLCMLQSAQQEDEQSRGGSCIEEGGERDREKQRMGNDLEVNASAWFSIR
jgi:hypothetical protein